MSESDRLRIERFVDLFVQTWDLRTQAVMSEPEAYFARIQPGFDFRSAPRDMICGPADAEGWAPWRPIDSPIDEAMTEGFERCLEAPLPPLFKAYLTHKCLIDMDLYEGTLPDIDPRHPLGWLEWCMERRKRPPFDSVRSLVPFTVSPVDFAQTLAFDTQHSGERGDAPVVWVWNRYASDAGLPGKDVGQDRQVFDSFGAYLALLQDWMIYKTMSRDVHFFGWLEQHGKAVPRAYYDAIERSCDL